MWCFFWDQVLPYVEGVRGSSLCFTELIALLDSGSSSVANGPTSWVSVPQP